MNFSLKVIEDFGGFESVKALLKNPMSYMLHNTTALEMHLMEYKRVHGIYEPNDKVIVSENGITAIYEIESIELQSQVVKMKCGNQIPLSNLLRHADKHEI